MSFYDLLNVSEDSPLKDIKDSYRALSKKFHPDKNPNDKYSEEKMKQITEAYEILSDYEKRRQLLRKEIIQIQSCLKPKKEEN